jgi:hypothetical protein
MSANDPKRTFSKSSDGCPAWSLVSSLMSSLADRHAMALGHVTSGRRIIERQLALIAQCRASGVNTDAAENLLGAFRRTQKIFEDDLAEIILRRGPVA